jgi:hypothetical protein
MPNIYIGKEACYKKRKNVLEQRCNTRRIGWIMQNMSTKIEEEIMALMF